MVENGMVRASEEVKPGLVITPLYMTISDDGTNEQLGLTQYINNGQPVPLMSVIGGMSDPRTRQTMYLKWEAGEPFVYTRDSAITNKPIRKGTYVYAFKFTAPDGESAISSPPGIIGVKNSKILRLTYDEFTELLKAAAEADR